MEYLGEGLQVAGIGFAVVMIALIALWIIMVAFSRFLNPDEFGAHTRADRGGGGDNGKVSDAHANADQRAEHVRRIAAITAAIAATMDASGGTEFRVVSVRPVRNQERSSWKVAGRESQLQASPRARTHTSTLNTPH